MRCAGCGKALPNAAAIPTYPFDTLLVCPACEATMRMPHSTRPLCINVLLCVIVMSLGAGLQAFGGLEWDARLGLGVLMGAAAVAGVLQLVRLRIPTPLAEASER